MSDRNEEWVNTLKATLSGYETNTMYIDQKGQVVQNKRRGIYERGCSGCVYEKEYINFTTRGCRQSIPIKPDGSIGRCTEHTSRLFKLVESDK